MFVKEVRNAKLYTLGSGDDQIFIVHLWGTPYEMCYAHGLLLPERLKGLIDTFWTYMEEQVVSDHNMLFGDVTLLIKKKTNFRLRQ